jgi:hypothetical protein
VRLAGGVALLLALAASAGVLAWAPLFDELAPQRIEHAPNGPAAADGPRVLLVSIDGLAPRVLAMANAPTLARLAREGAHARAARTVLPSTTLPAHASMLSGVPPTAHGMTFDRYQPWSRLRTPTLFDLCAQRGLRCGLFAGKVKFALFAQDEPGVERYVYAASARPVLHEALAWLREEPAAAFALIHLPEVDLAGHTSGWGSPQQVRAVELVDGALAGFLSEVRALDHRPLRVLVTSDHGGSGRGHGSASPDDVAIPWILWGDGVPAGAELDDVSTLDTEPTLVRLLGLADEPLPPGGEARFPLGGQ